MAGVLARERLLTGDTLAEWLTPLKPGRDNEVEAALIAGRSMPSDGERDICLVKQNQCRQREDLARPA